VTDLDSEGEGFGVCDALTLVDSDFDVLGEGSSDCDGDDDSLGDVVWLEEGEPDSETDTEALAESDALGDGDTLGVLELVGEELGKGELLSDLEWDEERECVRDVVGVIVGESECDGVIEGEELTLSDLLWVAVILVEVVTLWDAGNGLAAGDPVIEGVREGVLGLGVKDGVRDGVEEVVGDDEAKCEVQYVVCLVVFQNGQWANKSYSLKSSEEKFAVNLQTSVYITGTFALIGAGRYV